MLCLHSRTEVQAEFEKILSAKIKNNLSDAALGKLIHAVVSDEDVTELFR